KPHRLCRLSGFFVKQPPEIGGHGALRGPCRYRLDARVVVRRRVDVVGHEPVICGLDELETRDLYAVSPGEIDIPAGDRMVKSRTEREQIRWRPVAHLAGIGRTELEAAEGRVRRDRVDVLAADNLRPSDSWLGGAQMLLQQCDAVNRGLVAGRSQVRIECVMTVEQPHAESLATLVVLGDERRRQLPGRRCELAGTS